MIWTTGDTWVLVVGALSACACALLGSFLVLRKLSLMGDAISHAVLPGLVLAFLLTQSRGVGAMFVGAIVVGILTAVFTQAVARYGKVEEGAAMGVVFTILFAAGLILIRRHADDVDLDPQCVLFGNIELIALAGTTGGIPQAAINLAVVFLLDVLFVMVFYKELKISAFDPGLATTLGINADLMHYALMVLVALTAVASFEAVGSILVIAMLIVPAVAAHLLTDRLPRMLLLSLAFALVSAVLSRVYAVAAPHYVGAAGQGDTAALMAVIAGLILLIAILVAPEHGLIGRWIQRMRLAIRIAQEDMLGYLYRQGEVHREGREPTAAALRKLVGGGPRARVALWRLLRRGDVVAASRGKAAAALTLTDRGRARATRLVRSHRLWESYLSEHFDLPSDHLHMPAERVEHYIHRDLEERIEANLPSVNIDPHGREIPPPAGAHERDELL